MLSVSVYLHHQFRELSEWSKEHAWKVCIPQKGIEGSNPSLSAKPANVSFAGFFYAAPPPSLPPSARCLDWQVSKEAALPTKMYCDRLSAGNVRWLKGLHSLCHLQSTLTRIPAQSLPFPILHNYLPAVVRAALAGVYARHMLERGLWVFCYIRAVLFSGEATTRRNRP